MCWLSTVSYLNFVPSSLSSQFWGFCLCLSDPLNSSFCLNQGRWWMGWCLWVVMVIDYDWMLEERMMMKVCGWLTWRNQKSWMLYIVVSL